MTLKEIQEVIFKLNLESTTPFKVKGFEISDLHGNIEKKAILQNALFLH